MSHSHRRINIAEKLRDQEKQMSDNSTLNRQKQSKRKENTWRDQTRVLTAALKGFLYSMYMLFCSIL